MNDVERANAFSLGLSNLVNLTIGLALYFIARAYKKNNERLNIFWIIPATAVQIAYLWHATASSHAILPDSVTVWIYPLPRFFYNQYAFCMLPLFWGIICIACGNAFFLSKNIGKNILIAILAPFALFIGLHALNLIGYQGFGHTLSLIVLAACIVLLSLLMFVAIIRALMLIFSRLNHWSPRSQIIAIALVALAMPSGGLLLNRSIPFPVNFQAWEIYALVVVNATFLTWAALKTQSAPRFSFYSLCASFPFTLYFFVIFLPYTPLSIFGCIVLGSGFLVLTPTFLFTLHLYHLIQSSRVAHSRTGRRELFVGGLICVLLLPGFFTVRGIMDKSALNNALDFVYTPNIKNDSIEYSGSRANLRRALSSHRNYKNGIYYPLLSDYYSWLVFDNLVLPDDKIEQLELYFFDEKGSTENLDPLNQSLNFWGTRNVRSRSSMPRTMPPSRDVEIIEQTLRLLQADDQTTQATLSLKLKNVSAETVRGGAEYVNKLSIPAGVFVNGFRLHINGNPVPGRIFEKKTALWVYAMIRDTERRDPGVLFYNNPWEVELRVFPINRGTPVTVEIDFLIPEQMQSIQIPDDLPDPAELIPLLCSDRTRVAVDEAFTYITPLDTTSLPSVERENYVHLIIDRSQSNGFMGTLKEALQLVQNAFPQSLEPQITLANYNVIEVDTNNSIHDLPIGGNFDLDKAIAHAIARYSAQIIDFAGDQLPAEPIFITVGREATEKLPELKRTLFWQSQLSNLQVYSIGSDKAQLKQLTPETKNARPIIRVGKSLRPIHDNHPLIFPAYNQTKAFSPEYYDPSHKEKWVPLDHKKYENSDIWTQAIKLWILNHDYLASPGSMAKALKKIVAESRKSGILLPETSYIVVENEAQWRMLEKKENQKIKQHTTLEFLETPAPSATILLLGFGLWLVLRKRMIR